MAESLSSAANSSPGLSHNEWITIFALGVGDSNDSKQRFPLTNESYKRVIKKLSSFPSLFCPPAEMNEPLFFPHIKVLTKHLI